MKLACKLRTIGYKVQSGPWPFYRLTILSLYLGSLMQLIYGAPPSIQDALPSWYQFVYMLLTNWSAFMILIAIQFMSLSRKALYLERAGVTVLAGMQTIYIANYIMLLGMPKTPQTWMTFSVIIYCVLRARQLNRDIKQTNAAILKMDDEQHDQCMRGGGGDE